MSNPLEVILIVAGILDIAVATFALIATGRSHASGKLRFGKYTLMFAMAVFIALESNWLTRGLYHGATWISVVWNLMHMAWMLGSAWAISSGVSEMLLVAARLGQLSERVNRILDIYEANSR